LEILKPFRLAVVADILSNYKYDQPFQYYFTNLCKQNRSWGSKDRKIYKNLCFSYFRMGYALNSETDLQSKIKKAVSISDETTQFPKPDEIFPHRNEVSQLIDFDEWVNGLQFQKPLYLVLRRGSEALVYNFLKQNQIPYEQVTEFSLKLEADSKCNHVLEHGWAWTMDFASQKVADGVEVEEDDVIWDACSGAGGKSIYISNKYIKPFILTCSDKRFTILENLKTRFKSLGLKVPQIELCDLLEAFQLKTKYDKIILDVPCSGSGTWGRSPENILGFDLSKIDYFSKLQLKIAGNALKNLKTDGQLYYMTCSVFASENEKNVDFLVKNHGLKLESMQYTVAPNNESDTLFIAVLTKL
jgi:16S rRNA (cytosine967-C5)-methyltransferase